MAFSREKLSTSGTVAFATCVLATVSLFVYIAGLDSDVQQGIEVHRCAVWGLATAVPSVCLNCFARGWHGVLKLALSLTLLGLWWVARATS